MEYATKQHFENYPVFILGEISKLPDEIVRFDKEHASEEAVNARIEAIHHWIKEKSSKNYADDQRMIDQLSLLVILSNQEFEDKVDYIINEAQTYSEPNTFMQINKAATGTGAVLKGSETDSQKGELTMNEAKHMTGVEDMETENKAVKEAYVNYLSGDSFPEALKQFDRKYGIQEGLLMRMEAIDEETLLGHRLDKTDPAIEEKMDDLYAIYRDTEEKQSSFVQEEYCTLAKELGTDIEPEKGRQM
ncbi:hypothetical protein IA807_14035 [Listeria seeligeri]|uniref:hypothetical protein n=1 Tax=Listeria seeligeri TaxID=1640 RepID=UPI001886CFA2|nr:hypothetical protein [Listeria seeligeri]MBF2356034.1 hypothetical protein [Listeria seeligeri]